MSGQLLVHELGHCAASIMAGHEKTDGAALGFSLCSEEGGRGGSDVPSVCVDLAGALAEIVYSTSAKANYDKLCAALLTNPLDIILAIGPSLSGHPSDFNQAMALSDKERVELAPKLKAMAFSFLMLESFGLFQAVVDYHSTKTIGKIDQYTVAPHSSLLKLLKKVNEIAANTVSKNPEHMYSKVMRDALVAMLQEQEDASLGDMVKDSVHHSDSCWHQSSLNELEALAKKLAAA